MSFRPAERKDVELLWRWRLDDERALWYHGHETTFGKHEAWFARNRSRILMWEENGTPIGAVRIESDGTLNFSIAREHKAAATSMLREATAARFRHGGRLKAIVDQEDVWRVSVLKAAGFHEFPAVALIYKGE